MRAIVIVPPATREPATAILPVAPPALEAAPRADAPPATPENPTEGMEEAKDETDRGAAPPAEAARPRNPLIWRGFSDPRLAAGLTPLDPQSALQEELARPKPYVSPLARCYDSLDARAAAARETQDWSRRDRRGWRWGLSAEGIHLGPLTVPVAPPSPPPGEEDWRPARDPCVER